MGERGRGGPLFERGGRAIGTVLPVAADFVGAIVAIALPKGIAKLRRR